MGSIFTSAMPNSVLNCAFPLQNPAISQGRAQAPGHGGHPHTSVSVHRLHRHRRPRLWPGVCRVRQKYEYVCVDRPCPLGHAVWCEMCHVPGTTVKVGRSRTTNLCGSSRTSPSLRFFFVLLFLSFLLRGYAPSSSRHSGVEKRRKRLTADFQLW